MKVEFDNDVVKSVEPECADDALFLLMSCGYGYDCCVTVEGLKSLVDELSGFALRAQTFMMEGKISKDNNIPKEECVVGDTYVTGGKDSGEEGMIDMLFPSTAYGFAELIRDVSVGYDGENTIRGLKSLVDEILEYCDEAMKCLNDRRIM